MPRFLVKNDLTPKSSLLLGTILLASIAGAQTHTAVELQDPVYRLLEAGEARGLLNRLSTVKPYSRKEIARHLQALLEKKDALSRHEQGVLSAYAERFLSNTLWPHRSPLQIKEGNNTFQGGALGRLDFRLTSKGDGVWHDTAALIPYIRGDLGDSFSYFAAAGGTLDKVNLDAYAPYDFTKTWDGPHMNTFSQDSAGHTTQGTLDHPTFSHSLSMDFSAQFFDDALLLRFSRHRRDWGVGLSDLNLSRHARPFMALEMRLRPVSWFQLSHVFGSLNDGAREPGGIGAANTAITYQRMFALQRFEAFPTDWLSLAISSAAVGPKRLELGYLAPGIWLWRYQNMVGDVDNLTLQADITADVLDYGRIFASLLVDELATTSDPFKKARNMWAFQTGLKAALPYLPFGHLTLQYTKVEPFVYSHYPQSYAGHGSLVDLSYTNDGENLGFYLPPNSDEIRIRIHSMPLGNLWAELDYRFIRHGSHPSKDQEEIVIHGEIDKWMDYGEINNYPEKNFQNDGLYDYNHIIKLSALYRMDIIPFDFGASYTFAHTHWRAGGSNETVPGDRNDHIFGFTMEIFY